MDILSKRGIHVTPSNQIMFHLVNRGSPVLTNTQTGEEAVLNVGDYVFILHDTPYSLKAPTASGVDHLTYFNTYHDIDIPNSFVFGQGSSGIKMLSGAITLDHSAASSFLRALPSTLLVTSQCRGLMNEASSHYEARQLSISSRSSGGTQFLTRLAELFLVDAIRICTANITLPQDNALTMRSLSQIITTVQIMSNERDRKWSVSSLAARANMSRSAFAVAFRAVVGQPPLQYLTELRMRRAAELLRLDNITIKEVGYRVGYESDIAFTRVFKSFFGMTPRDYRKAEALAETRYISTLDHWSDFVDRYQ